jgi:HEAT repeat protein
MNLSEELRKFDGKHIEPLEAIGAQLLQSEGSVDEVLALANSDEARMQTAATWILKWLQERHATLSKSQTQEVLRLLRGMSNWEAKLHLLQMLGGLQIPSRSGNSLHRFLKEHACDENKFVRAWSYNGLFVLGQQHARFRTEVGELLSQAQQDPAASVRARVRRICKTASWLHPH